MADIVEPTELIVRAPSFVKRVHMTIPILVHWHSRFICKCGACNVASRAKEEVVCDNIVELWTSILLERTHWIQLEHIVGILVE